jgi:RNA polymerase subunit RPABC4/transcription elongation factor Spt4
MFTIIGVLLGIPMIIVGGILLFIGENSSNIFIDNRNIISNDDESQIRCPYCKELIKETATVCRFCGRDLPENHIKQMDKKYRCINCSKLIPKNLDYCPYCRNELYFCEECGGYVEENDKECPFCGIEFQFEKSKKTLVYYVKRLINNKNR